MSVAFTGSGSAVFTGSGSMAFDFFMTNAQKLLLPSTLTLGTTVHVTDSFSLHEGGTDYLYYTNGTEPSGGSAPAIEKYTVAHGTGEGRTDITWRWNNANNAADGGAWGDNGGNYSGVGSDTPGHFWDTEPQHIDHTYTFAHPAVQQLTSSDPSLETSWTIV